MPKEREEREGARMLPEFVKITTVGQTVAGRVKKFGDNDNGHFAVMEPVYLRDKVGGSWDKFGTAAVGLSTDILRKLDVQKDGGKFFLFQFVDTEATTRGGIKKKFKVYELDAAESSALDKKAVDRRVERDAAERNGTAAPFGFSAPEREPGEEETDGPII